jgi:transcription elongation factor GreA
MTEKRIADLDALLRQAVIIEDDAGDAGDEVRIGSTVVVDVEGDEERYTIVGAIEAKPAQGLISNESPVGRALLGLRPGEEAVAMAPHGQMRLRVIRIER